MLYASWAPDSGAAPSEEGPTCCLRRWLSSHHPRLGSRALYICLSCSRMCSAGSMVCKGLAQAVCQAASGWQDDQGISMGSRCCSSQHMGGPTRKRQRGGCRLTETDWLRLGMLVGLFAALLP